MKRVVFAVLFAMLMLFAACAAAEEGKVVDLIVFAGQSNMAGRGITSEAWPEPAPTVAEGAGWEFRAISDPTQLYPVEEPFGLNENNDEGIKDAWGPVLSKSGSMVTAFVNAYYAEGGVPVVAVSASKGGTTIAQWTAGTPFLNDLLARLEAARTWLTANGYQIRHTLCVWCQGESDGDQGTSEEAYMEDFNKMLDEMTAAGIERLLMVRIGQCNAEGGEDRYTAMIALQDQIAAADERVDMVSVLLSGMRDRGLMKDDFHFFQQGYNEVGTDAGTNAARLMK